MVTSRNEVDKKFIWDLSSLFSAEAAFFAELGRVKKERKKYLESICSLKGSLASGQTTLTRCLDAYFSYNRELTRIYTYAHLKHDEDVADEKWKGAHDEAVDLFHEFSVETAWIEPEIVTLDPSYAGKNPSYAIYLQKIIRLKPHTLSEKEETLISLASKALSTPSRAFSMLNNADLRFPSIKDSSGKEYPMSHGAYQLYLRSSDRTLREAAFKSLHSTFGNFENTCSELIKGEVDGHVFEAKARGYENALQAALFKHAVDPKVYHTLVDSVSKGLKSLHKYMEIRKKVLQVDTLAPWDLHCPLLPAFEKKFTPEEAIDLVTNSVAALGEEYQSIVRSGFANRWVDFMETPRKRSGAYSSGCYDSYPYILMNFHGTVKDLFTLSHEMGHSMHSYYTHKHQPYSLGNYPIFVAEVASTFNEELLFTMLYEKAASREEKLSLLQDRIDDIRGTLFRQTQFAEFELAIHQLAENGVPLTAQTLKQLYGDLNKKYYGKILHHDPLIEWECMRIPHFYYNFYVYQYATGISAAAYLHEKVKKEGGAARDRYIRFLSSGSSKYPIELLKDAGVDMCTSAPVDALVEHFGSLVHEFEQLLEKK